MVRIDGKTVWSYEGFYGFPYLGLANQQDKVKAKAVELQGQAVDPRTNQVF